MDERTVAASQETMNAPAWPKVTRSTRAFAAFFVVLAAATPATAVLSRWYHGERDRRALQAYDQSVALRRRGMDDDALRELRLAVTLNRRQDRYRLSLVDLLLHTRKPEEARAVLSDVLTRDPTNASANLMCARAEKALGRPREAERFYRRAVHGDWPPGTTEGRDAAIVELGALVLAGTAPPVTSEDLLNRGVEWPAGVDARRELGRILVAARRPAVVIDALRPVVQARPTDAEAWAWLAAAQFDVGDVAAAAASARRALRLRPSDSATAERLDLIERVRALDPTVGRLSDRERARRARVVLERTASALTACVAVGGRDGAAAALLEFVEARRARRRADDDSALDLGLAEDVWHEARARCPGAEVDPALASVMRRLSETP